MTSIIVTGASSGIGLATAELFLAQGWTVGVLARSADKLNALAQKHGNSVALPADVTDPEAVKTAFRKFTDEVGRLDVLFNNAGIFAPGGTIDEIALEDWYQSVNVNLNGMFLCAREAFGIMRHQDPQGGRIINNGSIAAHVPRPNSVHYSATKHAITGLTRSLSLDGRCFGIACGQIDIGNARTQMVQGLVDAAQAAGETPDPTMAVEDAARSVLHMATLPPEANVQFMTVMATTMPYIGRG
ncbi:MULTISPECIES: SDR family oxidoreductase [unclassified Ruegeria]|uniref:SDR family oxidoreductase n=1 Tax=unclassified Ruegeria TaxID=2625375 RepID=UPI001488CA11|nr:MULTISPECIES: SDR family oxidoreductase [unclassified Ruegeria]NOD76580.1 SDR family NAD(P)-dependent oxidoreductase [Ruegeria sp. HKCCD4332]NOD89300.1 SDR family NAD(P)-dependent oxidoreductase [Ruegeria sp. HKCCD4318]NOE13537.1 SDR family NAD(P)-dependent oxidoreductase [Ruegeria sp. HKCCD4318-2]NOG07714.1 SDR family oxidoreductase [Ruegeria sp. HKCCD4315]